MKKLVLHIGAQKCASSSIQDVLADRAIQDRAELDFAILEPWTARNLTNEDAATRQRALSSLHEHLERGEANTMVLSHEVLGNLPRSVSTIARESVKRSNFDAVVIVGYTRVQSSYFLAAFKQWGFRSPQRLQADIRFLERLGINATRFTPIERCMIVHGCRSTTNQDERNWLRFYRQLLDQTKILGDAITVSSNHIPTREHSYPLVHDFFTRAGHSIDSETLASLDQKSNQSFPIRLCDAVALHYCDDSLDSSWLPGPHERNRWLTAVGDQFSTALETAPLANAEGVLENAETLIDFGYRKSNMGYCDTMGVDPRFFEPSAQKSMTRSEFLDVVREAEITRTAESVGQYATILSQRLSSLRP